MKVSTCYRGLSRNSFSRRSGTEACQAKNNQQITDNSLEELKLKDSVDDRRRLLVVFSSLCVEQHCGEQRLATIFQLSRRVDQYKKRRKEGVMMLWVGSCKLPFSYSSLFPSVVTNNLRADSVSVTLGGPKCLWSIIWHREYGLREVCPAVLLEFFCVKICVQKCGSSLMEVMPLIVHRGMCCEIKYHLCMECS